jgi:hypothetical protein
MKKLSLFLLLFLFIMSCNNKSEIEDLQQLEQSINKEKLKEVSKLIGLTLKDKHLRIRILQEVKEIDAYGKSVSIAYLLGKDEKVSTYEKRLISKISTKAISARESKSTLFKNALVNTYNTNIEDFPIIMEELKSSYSSTSSSTKRNNELVEYMVDNNLEIYFPYEENFNWDTTDQFSVTFEDGNPNAVHEGYMIDGIECDIITGIDEKYLFDNPTIAIIPIDNDYLGEQVAYEIDGIEYIADPFDYSTLPINPPPPANPKLRLNYNVNPFGLAEDHLLTTFVPRVRVKGTDWKRTLSKALRMKIAKAGSDIAINPNGGITATSGTFYFKFDISTSDLKNYRWKNVGILWEPNWHKAKSVQQKVIWGLRRNASESKLSVETKLSMDHEGNYTPSTSITLSHTVSSGENGIFRGNKELNRAHSLSTIVGGSEYDNATYNYEGVNYSVRRINRLYEFFFVHDYTAY